MHSCWCSCSPISIVARSVLAATVGHWASRTRTRMRARFARFARFATRFGRLATWFGRLATWCRSPRAMSTALVALAGLSRLSAAHAAIAATVAATTTVATRGFPAGVTVATGPVDGLGWFPHHPAAFVRVPVLRVTFYKLRSLLHLVQLVFYVRDALSGLEDAALGFVTQDAHHGQETVGEGWTASTHGQIGNALGDWPPGTEISKPTIPSIITILKSTRVNV